MLHVTYNRPLPLSNHMTLDWQTVKVPRTFMSEVATFRERHPELGFATDAEVVRSALRYYMAAMEHDDDAINPRRY